MNTVDLDIEKIMNEIRESIADRCFDNLEHSIRHLENSWNVSPYHSVSSRDNLLARLTSFIKRIVRRCISFHTTPIVLEQNSNNKAIMESLVCLRDIENKNRILQKKLECYINKYDELLKHIENEKENCNC
jgi:hypothetical protein